MTAAVDTEFGGLFHLLNLAQYLGLYGDFTTPAQPGIALDPWDLVTLLGRALLAPGLPADPVWDVLRWLAGHGGPPGLGFAPPQWRVPAEWLAPFAADRGSWAWSAAGGRLRLAHPAGFLVLDVDRPADPAAALRRELARLPGTPRPDRRALPGRPGTRRLHRWVAALAGYARARLALALDHEPAAAVALLLRRPARIAVTPAHVDVAFSLATLPIEVRLAGLDRDLGWLPAAGRVVTYHFD